MNPRTLALRALLALFLLLLLSLPAAADVATGDAVILLPMPSPTGTGVVYVPVYMSDVVVAPDSVSGTLPAGVSGPSTEEPVPDPDKQDDPGGFPL